MLLKQLTDPYLAQNAYLIGCQKTGEAIIIDPERDIDRYSEIAAKEKVKIVAATETHIHADYLSGVPEFSSDPKLQIYLSAEGGRDWSYRWPTKDTKVTFLKDGDKFLIGKIQLEVLHTPGHTPEHLSFLVTDLGGNANQPLALISGDFLFVGDVGRPDLLESAVGVKNVSESSARTLQQSLIKQLGPLEDFLQILPGHGSGSSCGKALGAIPSSTLGYERRFNSALRLAQTSESEFVREILSGQPNPPLYFERMKRLNRDGLPSKISVPIVSRLSVTEFTKLGSSSDVKVIDTRSDRAEFDSGHFKNSISAPFGGTYFLSSAGSYIGEDDKILLLLKDNSQLSDAIRQLYRIGLDNILGWLSIEEARNSGILSTETERVLFQDLKVEDAKSNGKIIDVRTTIEYESGHIDGAQSIPYTRVRAMLADIPKNKKLYVHCGTGLRAGFATSYLQSEGYDCVHVDGMYRA